VRELKKINLTRRKAELNLKELVTRIAQLGSAMFSQLNKTEPGKIKFLHTYKQKIQEAQEEINTINETLLKIEANLEQQKKEKVLLQQQDDSKTQAQRRALIWNKPFRNR